MIVKAVFLSLLLAMAAGHVQSAEHLVKMLNNGPDGKMVFEPAVLQVAVGDQVTFVPTEAGHDSISVLVPEGAVTWHSKRNEQITVTIDKEGIYIYKCAPHFYYAMVGVIRAGAAHNMDAAKSLAGEIGGRFLANKARLQEYLSRLEP